MKKSFRKFAEQVAWLVGTPWAFALALGVLIVWAASGPYFGFSVQWQLSVNRAFQCECPDLGSV